MWVIYFVIVILIDLSEFNPVENCSRCSWCNYEKRPAVWLTGRSHMLIKNPNVWLKHRIQELLSESAYTLSSQEMFCVSHTCSLYVKKHPLIKWFWLREVENGYFRFLFKPYPWKRFPANVISIFRLLLCSVAHWNVPQSVWWRIVQHETSLK